MANNSGQRQDGVGVDVGEERARPNYVRLVGGGALGLALLLFLGQNFEDANVSFLWFEWTMPLFFALLISAVLGAIVGWAVATFRGRGERKRQEAMYASAMRSTKK